MHYGEIYKITNKTTNKAYMVKQKYVGKFDKVYGAKGLEITCL